MIDRAKALELARREVERKGLPWTEPISIHFGLWNYQIWTKTGTIGGNVVVKVNRRSGEATVVARIPR
jgi:hypothetical protein